MSNLQQELHESFARIMRTRRQNLGWSVQDLTNATEKLGHKVTRSSLAMAENGKNVKTFRLVEVIVICKALNLPLSALLFEHEIAMEILESDSATAKERLSVALFDTIQNKLVS